MYKLHMNKLLLYLRRNCFIHKQFIWFCGIRLSQNKYVEYIHVYKQKQLPNDVEQDVEITKNY